MQSTTATVEIVNGVGWIASPVAAGLIVNVVVATQNPEVAGSYPIVPEWDGAAAEPGAGAPNGSLNFQPGGRGPASNGNYGVTIWSVTPPAS